MTETTPKSDWCSEELFLQAYRQIQKHEGAVYSIYRDHLGNRTFGIGHLVTPEDPEWLLPDRSPVTAERVENVYADDLSTAFTAVKNLVPDICDHPEAVQLVLTNMAFNLGQTRLAGFKRMLAAVNERNYKQASVEMIDSRWAKQVPKRATELSIKMEGVS